MKLTVKEAHYHRNGISGEPFHAVRFSFTNDRNGEKQDNMLAIVFGAKDQPLNPRVAVFNEDMLPDVRFMYNSWRGDHFADELYSFIKNMRSSSYIADAEETR